MRERFIFIFAGMMVGFFVGFVFAGSIQQTPVQSGVQSATKMPAMVSDAIEAARNNPKNFEAQMRAADLYFQIQRYKEALAFLLEANSIQPDNFEAMVSLGVVNMEAGHLDESEKWFNLALDRQPDNAVLLQLRSELLKLKSKH